MNPRKYPQHCDREIEITNARGNITMRDITEPISACSRSADNSLKAELTSRAYPAMRNLKYSYHLPRVIRPPSLSRSLGSSRC